MIIRTAMMLLCLVSVTPLVLAADDAPERPLGKEIEIFKSPSCGCCAAWADYLSRDGFRVKVVDRNDLSDLKAHYGIRPELQSCHTAIVDGYAIEGHVPADDIRRLLSERPDALGLTAPGMPMLSPGMNSIEPKNYDVLLIEKDGKTSLYSRY